MVRLVVDDDGAAEADGDRVDDSTSIANVIPSTLSSILVALAAASALNVLLLDDVADASFVF